MTKRRHQNERDGRYTDRDGYKNHSGVIPGGKLPPAHHPQSLQSRWDDLPSDLCSEIAIMAKAIKQRWPVHENVKVRAVEKANELLESNCEKIAALGARLLLLMEKQNQDDVVKRRTIDSQIEEVIALTGVRQPPPDPDYLHWQRQQLLDTQDEIAPLGTYVRRLKNNSKDVTDDNGEE